jgi:pyruvate dehydrogenase E1 component
MFGFQRIGDLIWAAGDIMARGFLLGCTAGRTTLNGEGLQHQDGHSHLMASAYPTITSYDPGYAYEVAVIIREGLRRMSETERGCIYYLTLQNENVDMPGLPEGTEEGILRGIYPLRRAADRREHHAHILASGSLLPEALRAQARLADHYDVSADVWSATSYSALRREALEVERWNRLHPSEAPRAAYVESAFAKETGPFVAVSDSIKAVPDQIARWLPGTLTSLGTDGFGRSDTRAALRSFFEIDAPSIVVAVVSALFREGRLEAGQIRDTIEQEGIDPDRPAPHSN